MPTPFIMPKMDMDQEVVTIIEWLKKEGEMITKGEPVVTVETDKITSDIEAPETGILTGILYHENEEAPVTKVVAYILAEGETLPDVPGSKETHDAAQSAPAATTSSEVTSNLRATPVAEKMAASMNIDLAKVQTKGDKVTKTDIENYLTAPQAALPGKVAATPAARRMSKENDIDLAGLRGSGPRGRIQSTDVAQVASSATQIVSPKLASLPKTNTQLVAGNSVPLVGKRKRIAERLTASYQNSPHIYLTVEVDMSASESARKKINVLAERAGQPAISVTSFLVKMVAWALGRHPYLNSSLVDDKIILFEDANIGIATAIDDGLIVPVIQNVNMLSLREINTELRYLTNQARNGALTTNEVSSGTFTISNLGMFGISSFTAIINPPQSAILAVGGLVRKPVVVDDNDTVAVRPMMNLTLGADHRIVDGAVAAAFLADLVEVLETPEMALY